MAWSGHDSWAMSHESWRVTRCPMTHEEEKAISVTVRNPPIAVCRQALRPSRVKPETLPVVPAKYLQGDAVRRIQQSLSSLSLFTQR